MKVRMTKLQAGPEGVFQVGAVRDLPDKQAQELIDAGAAVEVKLTAVEAAALQPPETTIKPKPKKRGG